MKKFIFLIFLSLSFLILSCDDEPTDPCNSVKCGEDQYCQFGTCISYKCSAEHPKGVCKAKEHCEDGTCVPSICSAEFPKGICESDDEYCKNGECIPYECSRTHPNGACPEGEICLSNFKCGSPDCSPDNPNGTCESGKYCTSAGTCEPLPCSKDNPNGACDNGNICIDGECKPEGWCSADNPNGICGLHERCENGKCKEVNCGPGNPDGACPDGQYCDRDLVAGEWTYTCKNIPESCTEHDQCPEGYKCNKEEGICEEYTCNPECLQHQICKYGQCVDDPFFCGPESPNGWCEEGLVCLNGECQVPISNPCENADCGNDYCIVTNWEDDNGYECVKEDELCSESNPNGKCNAPLICMDGVCGEGDPCKDVNCDENMVCNPNSGECVEDFCKLHQGVCTEEHTICVNSFDGENQYQCLCELGYDYSFTEQKCIKNQNICSDKDCGEGICVEDGWAVDGWECVCNTGMEYLDENIKHYCIDPSTYNYCEGWDCGVGTCEEITNDDGSKYAICNCPENFYFNTEEKTCMPGIVCGNTLCENPLRETCVNNEFCEAQPCSPNFPEGVCGNAESCIEGQCVLDQECSMESSAGYCMDGYSCRTGICCKGGVCETTDSTLKHVGETCDLETNNCVNDAICLPTPTGDGLCYKLCDQTRQETCSELNHGDTVYHCVGRNVFDGVNYDKIGVCAVDDNCNKFDNSGCLTNQVCLNFRRTNFTQCYPFEENTPLGAPCSTGMTALGFNVGCGENLLCVDGRCVPNCDNIQKFENPDDINLCYQPFEGRYKIENLNVKDQGDLTFAAYEKHTAIETCDPDNNTCSNGSCVKLLSKDPESANSKDIGLCLDSCNFNSNDYKAECGGNKICFKYNSTSVCLKGADCNPVTATGCEGDNVCYPVTNSLNACMTTMGFGHLGDDCTNDVCQYGMCIEGVCASPCNIGDDSSCLDGETCQQTGDDYLNNTSHFASPSHYGTCQ